MSKHLAEMQVLSDIDMKNVLDTSDIHLAPIALQTLMYWFQVDG